MHLSLKLNILSILKPLFIFFKLPIIIVRIGELKMAKLYFRYGSMNSGKTALLLQAAHNYEEQGMKVIIAKPSKDTKGED